MLDEYVLQLSARCISLLKRSDIKIAIAESCSGGLLTAYLTSIPGASQVLDRGFITYSNESKVDLLGVSRSDIEKFGAVSAEVVSAMALGALNKSLAHLAISITGIAGPNSEGSKPVGLVYIGIASRDMEVNYQQYNFEGERNKIRHSVVCTALNMIEKWL